MPEPFWQITPYLPEVFCHVLANNTLFAGFDFLRFSFCSLLYGTPVPSAECQHPEAWPASTYGHLRGVSFKTVPANKVLFGGTVPANSLFELNNKVSVPLKNVEEGIFQVWLVKRLFRFVLVRAECVGLFTILVQT